MQVGPKPENKLLMNVESGKKIMMKRRGGSVVRETNFVKKLESGPCKSGERG